MKFRKDTPIIYLSGSFSQLKVFHKNKKRFTMEEVANYWRDRSGAKYRCYSFPYVGKDGFLSSTAFRQAYDNSVKHGDGILMDSGAHTFHNFLKAETGKISAKKKQKMGDVTKFRDQTVEAYIKFCLNHAKDWDVYVNFDYTSDSEEVYRMQKLIESKGLAPIPVYHGQPGTLDYFHRYVDEGAKLIGLGSGGVEHRFEYEGKRRYFDIIFNLAEKHGVRLHGFAITSLSLMFQYPFYSVDSTTWAKNAGYGKLLFPSEESNTILPVHVSERSVSQNVTSYNRMPKELKRAVERKVEAYGFDFQKVRESLLERYCFNASIYAKHLHEIKDLVKGTRAKWKSLL